MSAWEASVARNDFRSLVEAAKSSPQVVVRHGEPVAVVMSPDEYRHLHRLAGDGMLRFLASTPFEDGDIPSMTAELSDLEDDQDAVHEEAVAAGQES